MNEQLVDDLEEFCLLLAASQLIKPREIKASLEQLRQKTAEPTLADFVQLLVEEGTVTNWQVGLLKQRKYKGFQLDRFILLDVFAQRSDHTRYLARNLSSQERLILCVRPRANSSAGSIDCWTEKLE